MKTILIISFIAILIILTGCGTKTEPLAECSADSDCVPAQCCHPTSCTAKHNAPDCKGIFCTEDCQSGTLDCGQGKCICDYGFCAVKWS